MGQSQVELGVAQVIRKAQVVRCLGLGRALDPALACLLPRQWQKESKVARKAGAPEHREKTEKEMAPCEGSSSLPM